LDPQESLGFHCALTVKSFMSSLEHRLKGMGMGRAQFLALEHLIASGPLSQSDLVDRLSIRAATVARLVDRMERDGFVRRLADPQDRRVKRVVPTERATRIWPELCKCGREILDRAYGGVEPAEIETVKRVLRTIRANLNA